MLQTSLLYSTKSYHHARHVPSTTPIMAKSFRDSIVLLVRLGPTLYCSHLSLGLLIDLGRLLDLRAGSARQSRGPPQRYVFNHAMILHSLIPMCSAAYSRTLDINNRAVHGYNTSWSVFFPTETRGRLDRVTDHLPAICH